MQLHDMFDKNNSYYIKLSLLNLKGLPKDIPNG